MVALPFTKPDSNAMLRGMDFRSGSFLWDLQKEIENIRKHGINFHTAARAFMDPQRRVYFDSKHSVWEKRYFCLGKVGRDIITVRFTIRAKTIRIIGAGAWRKGRKIYEKD